MKKSVYSIVLMDDIIKAVDNAAYQLGTSRSNLINSILAEHFSCTTPEMRMNEIFSSISGMLDPDFQVQQQRSCSLMTLRTSLNYKYHPIINYKVELKRIPDTYFGTLKIQIRTQSTNLIQLFISFFSWWADMEIKYSSNYYSCELDSSCFLRKLINNKSSDSSQTAESIYSYISFLDKTIKMYFSEPKEFSKLSPVIENEYEDMIKHTLI